MALLITIRGPPCSIAYPGTLQIGQNQKRNKTTAWILKKELNGKAMWHYFSNKNPYNLTFLMTRLPSFWYMANKNVGVARFFWGAPPKKGWRKQQGAFRTQFAQNINQSILARLDVTETVPFCRAD